MSSKTCDLDYPTSKDVCAHLLPLQINKFFTSVSHEFWQGIDLYYYDREKGLSLEQCFLQYCGDLRKIQDGQYGTKVEKDRARIILNDVTIEKFKKAFQTEEDYHRDKAPRLEGQLWRRRPRAGTIQNLCLD
ncbi:hypothetical protein CPB97_008006 [Podila verticillata]|nr:hypothetical protein CPB97_008006 [Podila verticillata]